MSRQGAPGSQSGSSYDGAFQRPVQNASQAANARMPVHSMSRDATPDSQGGGGVSLPPLRQFSRTPPTPSSDGRRSLGMQSILNPPSELHEQRGRRRSAAQMESPSPLESTPANSLPSLSRPTSVDSSNQDDHGQGRYPGLARNSRHILSPRSPQLHRTQSLGLINSPTGTIDAHHTPFLSSGRAYMVQPGTSQAPPLPTPPAAHRAEFNFPPPAPTPPLPRADLRRRSMGFPQSGSASPTTSFSPFSQPAQLAGNQYEQNGPAQSNFIRMRSDTPSSQQYPNPRLSVESERNYIPVASTGQSSYQILTVNTQEGHSIQIPVDVSAASKSADEKRKRNAGASARFRQRRKEKEKEASSTIAKLEQQLREANEDVDFYKAERDYFRNVIGQHPGAGIHFPRPTSPRIGRTPIPSSVPASSATDSPNRYSEFSEPPEHRDVGRNVRRRTSTYVPAPAPAPVPQSGPGSQHQPYTSTAFPPIVAVPASQAANHSQGAHLLSHPQQQQQQQHDHHQQHPHPQQQHDSHLIRQHPESTKPQQHSQRPVSRDPFGQEARYERNWPPMPSGRETRR